MKKLFLLLSIVCLGAFAEASFDQIETLIEKQQYSAAASGLEGIIANHPNSAKAYYAMAQAQAGMGNQEKARLALSKARGIDPDLKFAPSGSVQKLEAAITPQVKNIEPVHENNYAWLKWVLALGVLGLAIWYYNSEKAKKEELEAKLAEKEREKAAAELRAARTEAPKQEAQPNPAQQATPTAAEQQAKAMAAQNAYAQPAPANPSYGFTDTRMQTTYVLAPTQTVIHHHTSSNDGLVTGMVLGQMMSNHHHDTTRVVEREVIREVPAAPSRDSSWDTPTPSRSSSWDTPSSSSSSWSSSSSSSSDSSWGSSDSSSSSSDSSWD